jgi:hypothetical protein
MSSERADLLRGIGVVKPVPAKTVKRASHWLRAKELGFASPDDCLREERGGGNASGCMQKKTAWERGQALGSFDRRALGLQQAIRRALDGWPMQQHG